MKPVNYFFALAFIFQMISGNAFATKIGDDTLIIAKPGSSADKKIQLGSSSQGVIKYDITNGKLKFANDGSTFKDVGSGSGGAGGVELLADNPGFESGISTNWTASSGGTVTARTGSNAMFDLTSARFQATASSQTYTSSAYAVPIGLAGGPCLAYIRYSTTEATNNYTFQVLDGSNNNLGFVTMTAPVAGTTQNAYVPFTCPAAATTVKLQVLSSGTATFIDLDNAHLGSDTRLSDLTQSQVIAAGYFATTASCIFARTNTALGALTDADCPGATVEFNPGPGTLQTTDFDAPKFTINNLPVGSYLVHFIGQSQITTSAQQNALAVNDGTTTAGQVAGPAFTSGSAFHIVAPFTYTSSGNRSFELFASSAANAVNLDLTGNNQRLYFYVEKIPGPTEIGVRVDQLGWHVDANISGANPSLGTSAVSTYSPIENGSLTLTNNTGNGVIAATIGCSSTNAPTGTTCSSGNESLSVSWPLPSSGDVLACASFTENIQTGAGGAVETAFQIVETATNAQTILQEGKTRIEAGSGTASVSSNFPFRVCGVFSFSTAGTKMLRLFYEQSVSGTLSSVTVQGDASASIGQRDIHWEVYPLNYLSGASPIFKGMVTTGSSSPYRIEYAKVAPSCSSTPCTIAAGNDSGWLTSISWTSTAAYVANIAAGVFSSAPACTVTTQGAAVATSIVSPTTTTTFPFITVNSAFAQTASGFNIICIGPK